MSSAQLSRTEEAVTGPGRRPANGRSAPGAHAVPPTLLRRAERRPGSLGADDVRQLQRAAGNASVARLLAGPPSRGAGLPDQLRTGLEELSGLALDRVSVHYDSAAPAAIGALAYARGSEIHVAPDQEGHLPHEAWHVVQQARGRVPATGLTAAGVPVNDDPGLEREADLMGAEALRMARGPRSSPGATAVPQDGGRPPMPAADPAGRGVAQRVRGGLEFTEDAPAALSSFGVNVAGAAVARAESWDVRGAPVSAFVAAAADLGNWRNFDFTLLESDAVTLTNDVSSAEWVIARHGADLSPAEMRDALAHDLDQMFAMRSVLAENVLRVQAAHPGAIVALVPGNVDRLDLAPDPEGVFVYRPGSSRGKAQITIQYSREETIRRINLLNASKFLTGTKVAPGEDVRRVSATEDAALRVADVAGTTSFSRAGALLTGLTATSNPITVGPAVVLSQPRVGLVKLMVLNDALATTMVRYAAGLGQAQEKNLQRFFPKSRRDEYVRAVAGAGLSPADMVRLRAEIVRTAAADAGLLYAAADAGALRTDEAFAAIVGDPRLPQLVEAKHALSTVPAGPVAPLDVAAIKDAVLGPGGALLAAWIARAASAYTDSTATARRHWQGLAGGVGNVMGSTRGFTPVAGAGPGAIYEFREREIAAEEPRWYRFGSLAELKDALDRLFDASQ